MGREATCICVWNGNKSTVKALIEPPELILRGELRRRVPISQLQSVKADHDHLHFTIDGESVTLVLGNTIATKWAESLLKPPPSLAKKLGIAADTNVWMIGDVDDPALKAAIEDAQSVSRRSGNLILARVDTPADLNEVILRTADPLASGTPIWFIYRKGPGHTLSESLVRSTALAAGIVDTKVAAVSAVLSALRFVKRKK